MIGTSLEEKKAKGKKLLEELEALDKEDQLMIIGGVRCLYMAKLNKQTKTATTREN